MSAIRWSAAAAACVWMVATCLPAQAVTGGQTDTFQDGTTNGWITGSPSPNPPVNVSSGGPAGASDAYLLATSSGVAGPGGRLVLFNGTQWAGDYATAGITALSMDVRNLGSTALDLHLSLNNAAYTLSGVALGAGSGWTRVSFSLLGANLSDAGIVLSNVNELRLYHGGVAPAVVAAQLGIDNITAVAAVVPEPATAALWLTGLAGLVLASRRRQPRRSHATVHRSHAPRS